MKRLAVLTTALMVSITMLSTIPVSAKSVKIPRAKITKLLSTKPGNLTTSLTVLPYGKSERCVKHGAAAESNISLHTPKPLKMFIYLRAIAPPIEKPTNIKFLSLSL